MMHCRELRGVECNFILADQTATNGRPRTAQHQLANCCMDEHLSRQCHCGLANSIGQSCVGEMVVVFFSSSVV